jgi:N-acetylmuramoyl-L-alanine amidase
MTTRACQTTRKVVSWRCSYRSASRAPWASPTAGIKHQRLFIRWAEMPAVLVETGFLTNPHEELKLRSFSYQWTVAQVIFNTIKEYLRNAKAR